MEYLGVALLYNHHSIHRLVVIIPLASWSSFSYWTSDQSEHYIEMTSWLKAKSPCARPKRLTVTYQQWVVAEKICRRLWCLHALTINRWGSSKLSTISVIGLIHPLQNGLIRFGTYSIPNNYLGLRALFCPSYFYMFCRLVQSGPSRATVGSQGARERSLGSSRGQV